MSLSVSAMTRPVIKYMTFITDFCWNCEQLYENTDIDMNMEYPKANPWAFAYSGGPQCTVYIS